MSSDNRPMTAVVEFQIRPENTTMEEWLDEWQKRAEDALEFEPETTAYEACINEEDPTRVLIFERYSHGHRSLTAHVERPAHAALNETMAAKNMTKRRVFSNLMAALSG